ncbi:hypothetical protein AZI86_12865 [Bdellovibrio bacteriovorus]|uniref:Restriction endonuclease type IV Mrr domain-containing protein n=1 Tax=Bdellovibrio bacteriovorus TaxID=959 RepID=A0A150WJF9_BDEBC|nr:hypothetical protein [Bdellovibrio bacteriovorus]KYG63715.1 hypothetical protein AZI86_12865 [Bdellovibrio bacteriovorus]
MKFFVLLSALFVSLSAFSGWNEDFAELKKIPRDYNDAGSICEEVARLDMQRAYPGPQYKVEVGIAYADEERTIGELDIIIFDTNMNKVYKVAEVKCWKDVRGGLKKAREQRARFVSNVHSNKVLQFRSTSTGQYYEQNQFQNITEFFSIAQKGSEAVGFDVELNYSLSELKQYRKDMIRCQNRGECASPYNKKRAH